MRWLFMWIAFIALLDGWHAAVWLSLCAAVGCFAYHETVLLRSKQEYDNQITQLKRVRYSLPESMDWLRRQEKH